MGRTSSTSADMTWWQPSWGIGDIPRDDEEGDIDYIGGDQAGGVLQVAGEAQHAASRRLGPVQTEGEQFQPSGLNKTTNFMHSVISRLRYKYVVSSNNMLTDNNKYLQVTKYHNLVYCPQSFSGDGLYL